jgi:N-acetylmuramoyl-L-alanine amidase
MPSAASASHRVVPLRTRLAALATLALAACAPAAVSAPEPAVGLPAVPAENAPLAIHVVHPTPDTPLPKVDSTFIFGSVGTGRAALTINGTPVEVAPNGAFVAYLPLPADGQWRLEATAPRRQRASAVASYRMPSATPAPAPAAPATVPLMPARFATVSGGADTLATGSDVAVARPTPTGTYRWFLPRGARVVVDAQRGEQYRVRLDSATTAWIDAKQLTLGEPESGAATAAPTAVAPAAKPLARATLRPAAEWVDIVFAAQDAPFLIEADSGRVALTVYGHSAPAGEAAGSDGAETDDLIESITYPAGPSARAEIRLARTLWGYKAFYGAKGELVLRLRRAPAVDPAQPLRGIKIVVDPGHPPAGATGPTGMREAEANLNIGLPLAERLREAGAEVILTRDADVPVSLGARVDLAVASDAHLLVSVHNNAFPEGVNPFRRTGTSTFYFHPTDAALARAVNEELVAFTQLRDNGANQSNLALVRPTWMPAVLTESLFMMMPQQEAALKNPRFADRLAAAHVRGLERFLRGVAEAQ